MGSAMGPKPAVRGYLILQRHLRSHPWMPADPRLEIQRLWAGLRSAGMLEPRLAAAEQPGGLSLLLLWLPTHATQR